MKHKKTTTNFAGITREQFKAAYARNAKMLLEMADKAKSMGGKKYRGYTAEELYIKAAEYRAKSK